MAAAHLSEWTESKSLQLIREFRARPILWDTKDLYFFKKSMKPKAWREIGDILNISPDKCKHKMVVLMSSFRREKAKIVHSMRDETDDSRVYTSTWFAFKDMAFLMDKETERKRQSAGIDEEDDVDDDSQNLPMKSIQHIEPRIPTLKKIKVMNKAIPVKKEISILSTQTIQEEQVHTSTAAPLPAPGPCQSASERNEEITSFTSFIANKMKKYSDTTKNAVQKAICDIIFKADQNYYEGNSCYEKLTIIDDDSDPLDHTIYGAQNDIMKVQNYSDNSDLDIH